jgi:hypothetical protein
MGVRKRLVGATLAAVTLLITVGGCAQDSCACQYPEEDPPSGDADRERA